MVQSLWHSAARCSGQKNRQGNDIERSLAAPPDQIIRERAEGNRLLASGEELTETCRALEIAESRWHRWLAQYGGIKATTPNDSKTSRHERSAQGAVANQAPAQPIFGSEPISPRLSSSRNSSSPQPISASIAALCWPSVGAGARLYLDGPAENRAGKVSYRAGPKIG